MLIIPEDPTPNLVLVSDISKDTKEKTLKDFFSFCGKIESFELVPDDDGQHQKAHVLFARPSAAKTAILLSNASVDDSNIVVKPYFEDVSASSEQPIQSSKEQPTSPTSKRAEDQESKPVSRVMTELLAAGYQVTDPVLAKGVEFDNKYGFTAKVQDYFTRIQNNLKSIDDRFHVSDKAMDVDQKLGIQEKTKNAADAVIHSETGQKLQGYASHWVEQIAALHEEARRIANERGHPSSSDTTSAPLADSSIQKEHSD